MLLTLTHWAFKADKKKNKTENTAKSTISSTEHLPLSVSEGKQTHTSEHGLTHRSTLSCKQCWHQRQTLYHHAWISYCQQLRQTTNDCSPEPHSEQPDRKSTKQWVLSSDKHKCLMADGNIYNHFLFWGRGVEGVNKWINKVCVQKKEKTSNEVGLIVVLPRPGDSVSIFAPLNSTSDRWHRGAQIKTQEKEAEWGGVKYTITYPRRVICGCALRVLNLRAFSMVSEQSRVEGVLSLTAPPRAPEYINHCGPQGCWE